eukprot:COSAG02_NODE_46614_length_347_cov_1.032258_1_plen_73_part_01
MTPPPAVVATHLCVARRSSLVGLRSNANRFVASHRTLTTSHLVTLTALRCAALSQAQPKRQQLLSLRSLSLSY